MEHIERLCECLKEARMISEENGLIFDLSFGGARVHVLKNESFLEIAKERDGYITMRDAGPNSILRYRYSCMSDGIEFFTFSERRFDGKNKTSGQYRESGRSQKANRKEIS